MTSSTMSIGFAPATARAQPRIQNAASPCLGIAVICSTVLWTAIIGIGALIVA